MTRALLLVLLAGCGFQIGAGAGDGGPGSDTGPDGTGGDGGPGTDATDAPPDGGPPQGCLQAWLDHTITFQTPAALSTVNSTSYDRDPFVSADELTLWFSNGGAQSQGGGDVFKATRATTSAAFGAPVRDADFSTSGGAESKMSMTADRTFAVIASSVSGGSGATDIWETSRPNTAASWGSISRTHVVTLDTAASELDPFVTPDGLELYYAPTSPAPQHIVVAKRGALNDLFGAIADVASVNTTGGNFDPMLIADGRVLVFASDRNAAAGGDNIWYATRMTANGAFGTPVELAGVNSGQDDGDPHVSADGCRIYFARNVGSGVDWELFSARAQ